MVPVNDAVFAAGEGTDLGHDDLRLLFQARDHRGLDGDPSAGTADPQPWPAAQRRMAEGELVCLREEAALAAGEEDRNKPLRG